MSSVPIFFKGEARLIRWGDTATSGRTITLEIEETDDDRHPFKGLRYGASHGQRMQVAIVLVDDNEEPIAGPHASPGPRQAPESAPHQPAPIRPITKWDELSPTAQAGIRCQDKAFQAWLGVIEELRDTPAGEEIAKQHVLANCKVMSRKELSIDPAKAALWKKMDDAYQVESKWGVK